MQKRKTKKIWRILLVVAVIYLQHVQLTYSASVGIKNNLLMDFKYQIINLLISVLPFLVFAFLSSKIFTALLLSSVLITVLSLANYYTFLFHGRPFFASDFYSIPTAINVLSEYSFLIDKMIIRLLIIFLMQVYLVFIYHRIDRGNNHFSSVRKRILIIVLADAVAVYGVFFSQWTLFPKSIIEWSWVPAVNEYGYEVSLLNSIYLIRNKYVLPEGYSADKIIVDREMEPQESIDEYPDIILILNETFADLDVYCDLIDGENPISNLYEEDGVFHGYSTVSLVGGGTNNSEYEFLTSNSMQGITISAPFLVFNMSGANSIVSYLKTLGYYTIGMHCGEKSNYGRNTAYPAIGFDEVYLGKESFQFYNQYGNRRWLDEDNFSDLESVYEKCGDMPCFIYLLTFQNHGGYEQNPQEYDQILIKEDFGKYTDDINEYLTSIKMSVEAFCELKEYFSKVERRTIIMMVGDHMPAFVSQLEPKRELNSLERTVSQKTVPYIVWSNYNINKAAFSPSSTMVDLVPMLLKATDMPLTVFYQSILNLNSVVPVRTQDGIAIDFTGNTWYISDQMPFYEALQQYYYMEYNNLKHGDDYKKEIFELTS